MDKNIIACKGTRGFTVVSAWRRVLIDRHENFRRHRTCGHVPTEVNKARL
jgi:hypothetical protein